MTRRLLAVHAHPDDESSKGAGTYARYAAEGAEVTVISCTGGELGDVLNPALRRRAMAERDMAGLRRREMAAAAAELGIQQRWLGYRDSGLPDVAGLPEGADSPRGAEPDAAQTPPNSFARVPLETSSLPLAKVIRELRPQVVITYDRTGGYPHPDHIRTHAVTVAAIELAADPEARPELGPSWAVEKLYYERIFTAARVSTVAAALEDAGDPRAHDLRELLLRFGEPTGRVTTRIDVSDFMETRDRALRSHESQVSPHDRFFFWPHDIQRSVWPFEDFERAWPQLPAGVIEHDLFAGTSGRT